MTGRRPWLLGLLPFFLESSLVTDLRPPAFIEGRLLRGGTPSFADSHQKWYRGPCRGTGRSSMEFHVLLPPPSSPILKNQGVSKIGIDAILQATSGNSKP